MSAGDVLLAMQAVSQRRGSSAHSEVAVAVTLHMAARSQYEVRAGKFDIRPLRMSSGGTKEESYSPRSVRRGSIRVIVAVPDNRERAERCREILNRWIAKFDLVEQPRASYFGPPGRLRTRGQPRSGSAGAW